jgi:transcriptional regulator with PAS, ATPase and Fis domain
MTKPQFAPSGRDRRRTGRCAILIKDSNTARARWIQSILRPFVERHAELVLSSQRSILQRRSDILIFTDPEAPKDERARGDPAITTLRYTLTKQAWQTMSSIPRAAVVAVVSSGAGVVNMLKDALNQLQRQDIQVAGYNDAVSDSGTWQAYCRLQIQAPEMASVVTREIENPVIAPGAIIDLLKLLRPLDDVIHRAIRKYVCGTAPVLTDTEILLDFVLQGQECLDMAASSTNQVFLLLDECDVVSELHGSTAPYFGERPTADILGRSLGDLFPEAAAKLIRPITKVTQHVLVNGQPTLLLLAPITGEPTRTLVILTRWSKTENVRTRVCGHSSIQSGHSLADIIGSSPSMDKARRLAMRAGRSDAPVVIVGESGTGKELFARAMHDISQRARGPFLPINCAAIPDTLMETELFGYEDGAFTGARKRGRPSLFERADKGTLFLDELADLSLSAQAALLRVLEEGLVTRVGGSRAIPVDVRIFGAANEPLENLVKEGFFRRDLYYRLCVIPLWISPLRERRQDVALLARHFITELGDSRTIPDEILEYFLRYRWPGNVRELQHCIKYMATMTDEPFTIADLPPHIKPHVEINTAGYGPNMTGLESAISYRYKTASNIGADRTADIWDDICSAMMDLIEAANNAGVVIGRRTLTNKLHEKALAVTERAVRARLRALQAEGLIEWGLGRSGVHLTTKGRHERALHKQ